MERLRAATAHLAEAAYLGDTLEPSNSSGDSPSHSEPSDDDIDADLAAMSTGSP